MVFKSCHAFNLCVVLARVLSLVTARRVGPAFADIFVDPNDAFTILVACRFITHQKKHENGNCCSHCKGDLYVGVKVALTARATYILQ